MADQQTKKALFKWKIFKILLLGLFGLIIGGLLEYYLHFRPTDVLANKFLTLKVFLLDLIVPNTWYGKLQWLAAPISLATLAPWLYGFPLTRNILNKWIVDPPHFVRSNLEEARQDTMFLFIDPESPNKTIPFLPLVGRENDLEALEEFLLDPTEQFFWWSLTGPSGVGKTRLAIEWLEVARQQGWDVGIVDFEDADNISGWRARKPTAFVIDEPWNAQELVQILTDLAEGARPNKPVRVLVIDQIEPTLQHLNGQKLLNAKAARYKGSINFCLEGLSSEAVKQLVESLNPSMLEQHYLLGQISGRPRKALILFLGGAINYFDALAQWADKILPRPSGQHQKSDLDTLLVLALAAIAGPVPAQYAHNVSRRNPETLQQFFDRKERDNLSERLPSFKPDDLGQEILLRTLDEVSSQAIDSLVDAALAGNPDALEKQLMAIWRERTDLFADDEKCRKRLRLITSIQERFDKEYPDRVQMLKAEVAQIIDATSVDGIEEELLTAHLQRLLEIVTSRVFDPEVRLCEAISSSNAMYYRGGSGRSDRFLSF